MPHVARRWKLLALIGVCAALTGCSQYRLEGLVIDGRRPGVFIVDADDPRLNVIGLPDASVELILDPVSLRPQPLGKTIVQPSGKFSIPIDAAGAGFLEYEIGLYVRCEGFSPVDAGPLHLPPGGKQLLIVMVPGIDKPRPVENLLDETRRESERWNIK